MNEINLKLADGLAGDLRNTNLGVINGIYLVEENSVFSKKETRDLEGEILFECSSLLPSFALSSGSEIKKEVRDSDDDHLYIKAEPTTPDEDGSVVSKLEFAEIKEEIRDDFESCYKGGKKTSPIVQDVVPSNGRGISGNAIIYGAESPQILPSNGLQIRIAHELLPLRGPLPNPQPDSCGEENASVRLRNKTTTDISTPTESSEVPKRRHWCSTCCKGFASRGVLNTHLRIHTGEKPFGCDVCQKAFARKGILINHMRIHTGERPYPCSVCPKRFNHSTHLRTHERIHTRERPYACSMCPKRFSSSSDLTSHKRTHTGERPYTCCVCLKRFTVSSSLLRHKRTHTKEKPYECSICLKRFGESSTLSIHMRTHTGEKPYTCSVCSKRFGNISNLKAHERKLCKSTQTECSYKI